MIEVAQIAYNPHKGEARAVYLPITDIQARALLHRGIECFDTNAEAHFWLVTQRKPGDSLVLASIFEYGGSSLIGYANI